MILCDCNIMEFCQSVLSAAYSVKWCVYLCYYIRIATNPFGGINCIKQQYQDPQTKAILSQYL